MQRDARLGVGLLIGAGLGALMALAVPATPAAVASEAARPPAPVPTPAPATEIALADHPGGAQLVLPPLDTRGAVVTCLSHLEETSRAIADRRAEAPAAPLRVERPEERRVEDPIRFWIQRPDGRRFDAGWGGLLDEKRRHVGLHVGEDAEDPYPSLQTLPAGTYRVSWHVADQHFVSEPFWYGGFDAWVTVYLREANATESLTYSMQH